jgi:hypothetical protein
LAAEINHVNVLDVCSQVLSSFAEKYLFVSDDSGFISIKRLLISQFS